MHDLTVICIDTTTHALAKKAVEDSMLVAKKAIVFSDKKEAVPEGAEWVKVYIKSQQEYEEFLWYAVPYFIDTPHVLIVQWDGFVLRPDLFDPTWLEYDYIGAPWPDGVVGNGGFSLRSTKLMNYVKDNFVLECPEDHFICRQKMTGFKFAPVEVAEKFSYEMCTAPSFPVFGFHMLRNFPSMLSAPKLVEREELFNDYVKNMPDYGHYLTTKHFSGYNPYGFPV